MKIECSLVSVLITYSHLPTAVIRIQRCKVLSFTKCVDTLIRSLQKIRIRYRHRVALFIIYTEAQLTVLLRNEYDGGSPLRHGRLYETSLGTNRRKVLAEPPVGSIIKSRFSMTYALAVVGRQDVVTSTPSSRHSSARTRKVEIMKVKKMTFQYTGSEEITSLNDRTLIFRVSILISKPLLTWVPSKFERGRK